MAWLPDTNVWIEILKTRGGQLEQRLLSHPPDQVLLCSVVKAELWHGAHKYGRKDRRLAVLDEVFASFVSLAFNDDSAWHYAGIRHVLETAGCMIGPNDLKIAAICRSNHVTLVTSNTSEFSRVPGLHVEDWSVPATDDLP